MLKDLILKNRSYRRFDYNHKIDRNTLFELVDLARLSPSAMNAQQLKYILSNDETNNEIIFKTLKWAGYLNDWEGPSTNEKPTAYIIILHDSSITKNCFWDVGIACQSILLGAIEKGLGGCQFAAIEKKQLRKYLKIDEHLVIESVIALGKPIENVIITEIEDNQSFKYYRDTYNNHYVPKRKLENIVTYISKP